MKTIYNLIPCCLSVLSLVCGCSKDSPVEIIPSKLLNFDSINFEPSMKGWELYSWPEFDDYGHSLLPGTNRLKTYEEVISNYYVVHGTDSLKMLLARLPEGESIHWIGRDWLESCWGSQHYDDLMVPEAEIVSIIENFCSDQGLELYVSSN